MVLVTCANGKTGLALIKQLLSRSIPFSGITKSINSVNQLMGIGVTNIFQGDLRDYSDVEKALANISEIYLITPNFAADEDLMLENILKVAKNRPHFRIILHSVIHPQISELPHHYSRLKLEQRLINSGVEWVILQPTMYMQNVLTQLKSIYHNHALQLPIPVDRMMTLVDLNDVAQVAADVVSSKTYNYGIFELCGETLSLRQQALCLSKLIGFNIKAEEISIETAKRSLKIPYKGKYGNNTYEAMFRYYSEYGLRGSKKVLQLLLNREANSFYSVAKNTLNSYVG